MCCPQYLFFSSGNSSCNRCDDLPFKYWAIWLGDNVVGHDSSKWTWSLLLLPLIISNPLASHPCRNNSLSRIAIFPRNTLYLYFVIHKMILYLVYSMTSNPIFCHLFLPPSFALYHISASGGENLLLKAITAFRR